MNDYGHGNEKNPTRSLTDAEIAQMTQDERDELMAECDWEPADPTVCDACAAYMYEPEPEYRVEIADVVMVRVSGLHNGVIADFIRWTVHSGCLAYLGTSSSGLGSYQACHWTADVGKIKRWFEDRGMVVSL